MFVNMGVSPIVPNGFADHYPYNKWLFHWEYTQHFQTNPYLSLEFVNHCGAHTKRRSSGGSDSGVICFLFVARIGFYVNPGLINPVYGCLIGGLPFKY